MLKILILLRGTCHFYLKGNTVRATGQVRGSDCTVMARDCTIIIIHNLIVTEGQPRNRAGNTSVLAAGQLGWLKQKNVILFCLSLRYSSSFATYQTQKIIIISSSLVCLINFFPATIFFNLGEQRTVSHNTLLPLRKQTDCLSNQNRTFLKQ